MPISEIFHWCLGVLSYILGIGGAIHVLLTKRDPRSALIWVVICVFVPIGGVLAYVVFGVNRIKIISHRWHRYGTAYTPAAADFPSHFNTALKQLVQAADYLLPAPFVDGNELQALFDGTNAYPEMLAAIEAAQTTVFLSTYIFGSRGIGYQFIEALAEAQKRGVDVRVLIDWIGSLYTWPPTYYRLKKHRVRVAYFLPPLRSWYYALHLNLRNHAKLLVIDSRVGFTGGMNIHQDNVAPVQQEAKIHDIHFKLQGPIVGQMQEAFLTSWYFATKEKPEYTLASCHEDIGSAWCRSMSTGPNQDYPGFLIMLTAAINAAKEHVRIMTPYFVPGPLLSWGLRNAAMRGVTVEIMMPEKNNLRYVKGASEAILPTLLPFGVKAFYQKKKFDHSKLFIMDEAVVFLGSSNLDTRSFYLNFEFDLMVYDPDFAKQLTEHFMAIKQDSFELTPAFWRKQGFLVKLKNSFYRLFAPYL